MDDEPKVPEVVDDVASMGEQIAQMFPLAVREAGQRQLGLQPRAAGVGMAQWQVMMEQATTLLDSGLLPKHYQSPAAVVAVMEMGRELGLQPMVALNTLYVVHGKVACEAKVMAALIYREHGAEAIRIIERTPERSVIAVQRRGGQPQEFTFTMKMAEEQGLLRNNCYKTIPATMLTYRNISQAAQVVFPDTVQGMLLPEEVGCVVEAEVVNDQASLKITLPPPSPEGVPPLGLLGFHIPPDAEIQETPAGGNRKIRAFPIAEYPQTDDGRRIIGKTLSNPTGHKPNWGPGLPATGKVEEYRDRPQEVVVIIDMVRHPDAKDAVHVEGFNWRQAEEDANGVNPTTGGDGAGEPTTTQTDVDTGTLGQPSPAPATTFQPEEARELAMEAMQALRDAHPGRRAAIDKAIDELTREHVGAGQLSRCRDATALLAYAAAVRELITNPF